MKNYIIKITTILAIIMLFTVTKSIAAPTLNVSASNLNPEVGSQIRITIGNSNLAGNVSIKVSNTNIISGLPSTEFIDYKASVFNVTVKNVGSTTITVTPLDLATTDPDNPTEVTGSKSITINVKAKPQPKPEKPTDNSSNNSGSSSTSNKTPATNKPNTDKNKVKDVKEVEQKEEATPQFGMNSLILNGIKENGEKQEITFEPTFNIDRFEYSCNIQSDIKDIEVLIEAGEYNDYVKIEKPEKLVEGENVIKVIMSKDETNLTYTIKVNKQKSTIEENNQIIEDKENEIKRIYTVNLTFT